MGNIVTESWSNPVTGHEVGNSNIYRSHVDTNNAKINAKFGVNGVEDETKRKANKAGDAAAIRYRITGQWGRSTSGQLRTLQMSLEGSVIIMTEQLRKQINYTVVCVNEFARKHALHPRTAFLYLYNHQGIEFLQEHYEIEHTLSLDNAVEDLEIICKNNGGEL